MDMYGLFDPRIVYIAGFLDGEGSVMIQKTGSGGYYSLRVQISNTDIRPLEVIKLLFGGNIHKQESKDIRHKSPYMWYVNGDPAAEMLERLLPHLIIKKERALLGIQIIGAPREDRLRIYNKMSELNKTGPTPLK